jgi:hypothetical protein
VALAVRCERYDDEGNALSVHGILEGFTVRPDADIPFFRAFVFAVIRIHAGEVRGKHAIEFLAPPEGGLLAEPRRYVANFTDEVPGWEQQIPLHLTVTSPGRYWYELRFDGEALAWLPVRIDVSSNAEPI